MANSLQKSGSATAASNIARVSLGPSRAGETWTIKRITVSSTSSTLIPTCFVYQRVESPSALIDGTSTGTFDTNNLEQSLILGPGEVLIAVWTADMTGYGGVDTGATCILTIEGETNR